MPVLRLMENFTNSLMRFAFCFSCLTKEQRGRAVSTAFAASTVVLNLPDSRAVLPNGMVP
jgi:hypothetical protein